MTLYSFNVNGIRAAVRKGFISWLEINNPEVVCLQEIKANEDQLPMSQLQQLGYDVHIHSAHKKGYSGVAILSRSSCKRINIQLHHDVLDAEGRVIAVEYPQFILCNAYFPSGTTPERQALKMDFLPAFGKLITRLKSKPIIVTGDFNICHRDIDIHDPVRNKHTPGFLPEERHWMDVFTKNGFVDGVRIYNGEPNYYSWWSYRSNARERNKGWRIDYIMVDKRIANRVKNSGHDFDVFQSDHCPVWVSMDI